MNGVGGMNKKAGGLVERWLVGWAIWEMNGQVGGQVNGRRHRQTDGRVGGQVGGRADEQEDRETEDWMKGRGKDGRASKSLNRLTDG